MVQCGPELCGNDPKWRDEEDERSSAAQGEIAAHRVDVRRPLVAGSFGPEPVAPAPRPPPPPETACPRRGKTAAPLPRRPPRSPQQADRYTRTPRAHSLATTTQP